MPGMTKEQVEARIKELLDERIKAADVAGNASLVNTLKAAIAGNAAPAPEKGATLGRIVRSLAIKKGDTRAAADYASTVLHDETAAKALGTSPGDAGGFLVPTEFSTEMIELLRPRSVVRSAGPLVIPMETGTMAIPRLAGGATASYQSESTATNASQEKLEQLRLTWRKLTAIVPISNELLRFSSPSADSVVRDDLVLSMAIAQDVAMLRGDGTANQIRGLKSWCVSGNSNGSAGTSLANVDTDIKTTLAALENNNVRMIKPAWFMSPRSKNMFAFLRTSLGPIAYPTMASDKPTLLGYPVYVTNNIPNNLSGSNSEVYFADMADVVIGEATQFILEVSNEATYQDSNGNLQTAFGRDETVIKAIARHDFVMRHDLSVAMLTGVAWS